MQTGKRNVGIIEVSRAGNQADKLAISAETL